THTVGPRAEVWGDAGSLVLDEADRLWGGRLGEPLVELTEPETLPTPPGMQYVSLWGLSFVRLVDHLVQAVVDGASVAPAATFRDGLAVQRVLDAVRQSARTGWIAVQATSSRRSGTRRRRATSALTRRPGGGPSPRARRGRAPLRAPGRLGLSCGRRA